MTTAGQIIKHEQDQRHRTSKGKEDLLSAHGLLRLYGCPASGCSGPKTAYLLSIEKTDLGGCKAALPENECQFNFHASTEHRDTIAGNAVYIS